MKPPVERTRKRTPPRALTADPAASETSRPRDARGPPLQEAARYAALEPLSEVNECCLELLVQDARSARPGAFPLTVHLRELLSGLSPEIRTRAGRRSLLLVDLELSNVTWWQRLIEHPTRPPPVPPWRGGFPKARGVLLTRATLVVAWHSLRSDPSAGCPMGMAPAVAPLIAGLTFQPSASDCAEIMNFARHLGIHIGGVSAREERPQLCFVRGWHTDL